MSIQTINNHQTLAQYTLFSEAGKSCSYNHKNNLKMGFLLAFIADSIKLKRDPNEDNFPKGKWWKCGVCNRYNLVGIWKCAYCGHSK